MIHVRGSRKFFRGGGVKPWRITVEVHRYKKITIFFISSNIRTPPSFRSAHEWSELYKVIRISFIQVTTTRVTVSMYAVYVYICLIMVHVYMYHNLIYIFILPGLFSTIWRAQESAPRSVLSTVLCVKGTLNIIAMVVDRTSVSNARSYTS